MLEGLLVIKSGFKVLVVLQIVLAANLGEYAL